MATFEQKVIGAWQKHQAFNAEFATEMLPICIEHHDDALDLIYIPDAFNRMVSQGFMEVDFDELSDYINEASDDGNLSDVVYTKYLNGEMDHVQVWTTLVNDCYCADWGNLFEYMVLLLTENTEI